MTSFSSGRGFRHQAGTSLLEVLVAILLLSFGMLALGVMLSFSVQMPKLSGYRVTATNAASSHIERIRANPGAFGRDEYSLALSYDGTTGGVELANCSYPSCTEASLATMDNAATKNSVRAQLPAGGILVTCDTTPCSNSSYGNLWIVWQEPATRGTLNPSVSDNCPGAVTSRYVDPKPRCLYVRFRT